MADRRFAQVWNDPDYDAISSFIKVCARSYRSTAVTKGLDTSETQRRSKPHEDRFMYYALTRGFIEVGDLIPLSLKKDIESQFKERAHDPDMSPRRVRLSQPHLLGNEPILGIYRVGNSQHPVDFMLVHMHPDGSGSYTVTFFAVNVKSVTGDKSCFKANDTPILQRPNLLGVFTSNERCFVLVGEAPETPFVFDKTPVTLSVPAKYRGCLKMVSKPRPSCDITMSKKDYLRDEQSYLAHARDRLRSVLYHAGQSGPVMNNQRAKYKEVHLVCPVCSTFEAKSKGGLTIHMKACKQKKSR